MRHVILGTAGHIDHGKSALVKALTGIDPDRLKEEKERGITIDLGFADLSYPDGLTIGIVDVPGHERLVRNMLAEGVAIVPVSSKTMFNMDLLKDEIRAVALKVEPKPVKGLFRLPIDRVFTLKGFGTVVTGTAVSGNISVDDPVEILPSNIKSKVRGLHSHGKPIQTAYAGQRVAINLQGVDKEELRRGDSVVLPGRV